tara:strand:- start:84 stop:449 length:366 start_codon:yes stop_codon:yes gene_type:complete
MKYPIMRQVFRKAAPAIESASQQNAARCMEMEMGSALHVQRLNVSVVMTTTYTEKAVGYWDDESDEDDWVDIVKYKEGDCIGSVRRSKKKGNRKNKNKKSSDGERNLSITYIRPRRASHHV